MSRKAVNTAAKGVSLTWAFCMKHWSMRQQAARHGANLIGEGALWHRFKDWIRE